MARTTKTNPETATSMPDRIVMERRMVVAEVPVGADGTLHPFIALLQETAEALHQQWGANGRNPDIYGDDESWREAGRVNSTGMESITDSLVAEWNGTRLTIEFAPIDEH